MNRGTTRNLEILDEIVALRKEIADLYEVPSFAHYVTKRRMVENPETVTRFLDEVKNGVTEAELRDLAAARGGQGGADRRPVEQAKIERWDVVVLPRAVARTALRGRSGSAAPVLPDRADVQWMLDITERLYGVRFERGDGAGVARRRDVSRRRRCRDRRAASAASTSISIRAPTSTSTPRRGRCAACQPQGGTEADQRAGHELRSRRTDAQRGRRRCCTNSVTCCTACCRRPSTTSTPARASSATSSRRRRRCTRSGRAGMESLALMRDHCATCPIDRRVARAAPPRARRNSARASTTAASFSTPPSTWRCRASDRATCAGGVDARWRARRRWATSTAPPSPARSSTSPAATRPATTATCGRR